MASTTTTGDRLASLFSLHGKVALVTGGGRGIGAMIARGLIEAGARVYVASRRAESLGATADVLSGLPGSAGCRALPADLSRADGCDRLAAELTRREPALDILVNNAGATWLEDYGTYPGAAWDRVLDLNVKAVFHLTRALTPVLAAAASPAEPARVVNIGSVDAFRLPPMDTYAYPPSKAAVHHLTRVLARTLAPRHITVNAVAAGPFDTRMTAVMMRDHRDEVVDAVPLRRIGEPDDAAGAVIFLTSRAGAYLTGTTVPVDGGMAGCL
jgi:NAD(P)-dependent dehydrogenase (short-subunit alcohol dehydrogenase family)